ncbi:MMPL family transporter [Henriciella litoralis]|uniref:MMPL family transporter n=1 Tax=Henriciella litoralis TaxID=568102 RepID=UPI0009FF7F6D|nr:hypothetical protein [Henriciella litoralis]
MIGLDRGRARAGLILLVWAVVVSIVLSWRLMVGGMTFDTNIRSILPKPAAAAGAQAAVGELTSNLENRIALLVSGDDAETASKARQDLKERLIESGLFVDDRASGAQTARWIFENRREILCEASAEDFDAQAAQQVWNRALAQVYGVGTPVSGAHLRADPFLLTYRLANCLSAGMGAGVQDNSLISGRLTQSASSLATQEAITELIGSWQADWSSENLTLDRLGVVFHAANAARSARTEISLIGGVGLLGVILLFLFAFRRVSSIALVVALIGISFVTGFALTALVFGTIHLLVLVFAAMLVGVVSDYAVHTLAARASNHWPDDRSSRKLIAKPLTVSMLTTVAGFSGLWFLGLSIFAQLAVFAAGGVITAWFMVQYVLIPLDLRPRNVERAHDNWTRRVAMVARLMPQRIVLVGLGSVLLGATIGGVLFHTTLDDVRQFQPRDPGLLAEEDAVLDVMGVSSSQRYLVSYGHTLDEAKQAEEAVLRSLEAGDTTGPAYSRFDPSEETRAANRAAISTQLEAVYLDQARAQFGIEADEAPESDNETAEQPDWLDSLHLQTADGKHYLVAQLTRADVDLSAFSDRARVVDVAGTYSDAFAAYRAFAAWALLIASIIAVLIVLAIYRNARAVLIIACPCAAMLGGIFIPALFGMPISFFSVAAGMVLFGIGIDYAAFFWEAREKRENWTLASVLVGALTTELSMGLLGLSATFPVKSFGVTVAVGVICALIYTMLVFDQHHLEGKTDGSEIL